MRVITFAFGAQVFALPVAVVREVLPRAALLAVPEAPPGFVGLLRLRGTLLPIVELRHRLGLPAVRAELSHRIIVTQAGSTTIGCLVDEVHGLLDVPDTSAASSGYLVQCIHETPSGAITQLDAGAIISPDLSSFLAVITPGVLARVPGQERVP